MEPRLSLKLSQRLVLTPTLQQAIKLLQYSRQELLQYIRQELLENPTLEEKPASDAAPGEVKRENPSPETAPTDGEGQDGGVMARELDNEWFNYLGEFGSNYEPRHTTESPTYENVLPTSESLQDHLLKQLHISARSEEEKLIGYEIIGNIDESGYLRAAAEELSESLRVTPETVEAVIRLVQEIDPPGIGARNLSECLLQQLRNLGLERGIEGRLVREHLSDFESRRLKKIARAEKVPLETVCRAAKTLAGLDPRPGSSYSQETTQYIVPDINICKVGNEYQVQLVEEGLPQLRINSFYRRLFRSGRLNDVDKEFLNNKVNSARWLIKSILQRQQTIIKVAKSIVKFQREFLDRGLNFLQPLVLRTVAEDINMHESTVSRVTSKKYAQTPQGLLELKFFFNSAINRSEGGSMASVSVQEIIQKIIAQEDTRCPLSDLEIVRCLREEHLLNIARRTVAKYRGLINILPASRRRQMY